MVQPPRTSQIITRLVDGQICAYDLATSPWGALTPAVAFPPCTGDDVIDHTSSADLRHAVYTTLNGAVCVTRTGDEVWRTAFDPFTDKPYGHRPECELSLDGSVVWVYRPDAMAGRDRLDQWVALDAETGAVIAQADLETVGHGGRHYRHPVDGHVLLDVGEGQDGSVVHRAALTDGQLIVTRYPWTDRCLIDLAPGGEQFMTVDHGQFDVAFHTYPSGEVIFELPVEAFGHDPEEACVEWSGGYLTEDTAVATIAGETDDGEEWFRTYEIDIPAARVGAELSVGAEHRYDFQPLGDGSWLITDPSGHPVRCPEPVSASTPTS